MYCLTQLYDVRDIYRIYYAKNSACLGSLHLPSSDWEMKNLSKQLYSIYVRCIQWGGKI